MRPEKARHWKHGYRTKSDKTNPTYQAWRAMNGRCGNPNNDKYARYGGRGITICERWRGEDGFVNFLADLGEKPTGLTLGRIDNNGNYEPGNCRWETQAQQAHNRHTSALTEDQVRAIFAKKPIDKRTKIVTELAARYGVCRHSIYKIWDGSNWAKVTMTT